MPTEMVLKTMAEFSDTNCKSRAFKQLDRNPEACDLRNWDGYDKESRSDTRALGSIESSKTR